MQKELSLRVSPRIAAIDNERLTAAANALGVPAASITALRTIHHSIDARQRNVMVNLTLRAYIDEPAPAQEFEPVEYPDVSGRPQAIVVGAGPAGLFAALKLIELGVRPIVLERGKDVHARKKDIALISRQGLIDPDSNYAFGEGGAGAFSDGKLYTRSTKRGDVSKILRVFCQHGASTNILSEAHPHIGTDRLPRVIENMRHTIIRSGGEVHFNTRVTGLLFSHNMGPSPVGAGFIPTRADSANIGAGFTGSPRQGEALERGVFTGSPRQGEALERGVFTGSPRQGEALERGVFTGSPRQGKALERGVFTGSPRQGEALERGVFNARPHVCGVLTADGREYLGPVILATGHSARDVYRMLYASNVFLEPKGLAIGVRLEHPARLIDQIFYHSRDGRGAWLPAAEYRLSCQQGGRGVYSFCMCPGGFVIPAATGPDQLVVNGMSPAARNSKWSNSGIVVELRPEDLAELSLAVLVNADISARPLRMMFLQEALERLCFLRAGETQHAPAQRMTDFVSGRHSDSLPSTSYQAGTTLSPLHEWLPAFLRSRLRAALLLFGERYRGFLTREATLLAIETRTSAPVRITRDRATLSAFLAPQSSATLSGLYPCGEGAGYAGGIVSAAIDGERCATALAGAPSMS